MIRTLGRFELKTGDNVARNVTRRSALVLALMIVAGAQGLRRDQICELLWGRREQFQARASLRQALVELRHYASSPDRAGFEIVADSDTAKLSAPADAIDLWLFDHLVSLGTPAALEQAAHLYEGELLAGVDMPDEALEWLRPHRETCFRKALQLAEALSELAHLTEDVAACGAALANRLLVSDPAAEDAHRALIRIYQRQGKNSAAARQFKICTEALNQALGVAPERRTAALLTDHTDDRQEQPAPPLQRPPPSAKPSVVVMPFEMLSAGPGSDDYVADGIVEEVTATLSRIRDFFVIARQSAFASREKFADVQQLGKDLGVKYVVQGTLRRAGDQLRVSVRLVEAESRALLWTERYDGSADDLFLLQDRIAEQVAGAMHPALLQAEIESAKRKPPGNLRAYELLLQSYPKLWRRAGKENAEAIDLLNQAIAIDPLYGRAHALLAWAHSQNVVYLWSLDAERERRLARQAVMAAERLIDDDPLAMTALGAALGQSLGEGERARSYVETALSLDPNSAWAWARLGWILVIDEQLERAKYCFERALRLSPVDPLAFNFKLGVATCWGHLERYELAIPIFQEILARYPEIAWAHRMLAAFAALAGDIDMAHRSLDALLKAQPKASIALMRIQHPGRNSPKLFARLVKGWRLAGLPEES